MRRFISPDSVDVVTLTEGIYDKNLYAYCDNNPITRQDDGGEFWNFIVGAVVGGVVSAVTTVVNQVQEEGWGALTSGKTWAKAGVSAVGGAISGAVAASGLGAMAQAGISAVVSGVSNLADQVITKGVDNIDAGEVITSAAMGGGFSLIGTGAGFFTAGKLKKAGAALIDKGRDKLLTGVLRRSVGQSHSALIRQGAKFMAEGTKKLE